MSDLERNLAGRVAWVTGGASGMGRAIVLALARAGAHVALGSLLRIHASSVVPKQKVYLVGEEELEEARLAVESMGTRGLARDLDVCDDTSVNAFFDAAVGGLGEIDILVNAAGTFGVHHMAGHPDALWHRTIDVNLNGPYRTIKRCLPGMMARGWGRIVNIASTGANVGADDHAAYCASKSGLIGLTRCVALEGASRGVTCNALNPGWVATPMNRLRLEEKIEVERAGISVEEYRERLAQGYPQKRLVTAEDVAAAAVFLCRDEAQGINGEDITVAGGSRW